MLDVMAPSPLEAEIRRRIALAGPMPVRQFMALCLTHPEHGYYMTRDPLGRSGDFITAPEISQVFGELIGLWAASVWHLMGQPENVRIVELGPGRGTMMLDALRAAQVMPAFRAAIVVHLVEISPVLQHQQQMAFSGGDVPVVWHQSFGEVPEGPAIVLANEFIDALPVNQAVKQLNGWYERVIEIDADDRLTFGIANEPIPLFDELVPPSVRDAPLGSIYEWRTDNLALALGQRVVHQGGAALLIDYGHVKSSVGETLQATRGQAFASPLAAPGEADLTAHVDFQAMALAAESMGARVHGPLGQAPFLRKLGVEKRAAALKAYARKEKADEIDAAVERLLGEGDTEMGTLFKVFAIADPKLGRLPGFEDAA
jgi:SAM-dependent MidA family methyltransferase